MSPRLLFQTIVSFILISASLHCKAQQITVGNTGDYPTLSAAEAFINLGDTVWLQSQVFSNGSQFLNNVIGTFSQPVVIIAETQHGAIFQGGSEAIHLIDCSYIELNGLVIEQQNSNGINIDDGGDYSTPSLYVTVRNCIFRNMAGSGNNDFLKMSGVDNFLIENCSFTNGNGGGSGVDFVGCHWGTVQDCLFDDAGVTGIQNKGGTHHIRIQRNVLKNMSQRALNLGGSTGLQYFRPELPNPIVNAFEAADIEVFSNVFINNWAPIAYVGCVNVKVYNNTIYQPANWAMRILQENTTAGFLTCANNEFSNNIIYLPSDITEVNIGPNTDASSFVFTNNLWFNASSTSWSPNLPVVDPAQLIAAPQFNDAANEDFSIPLSSPAVMNGAYFAEPSTDFLQNAYFNPPAIGAFERDLTTAVADIEDQEIVNIFPNPCAGHFTITPIPSKAQITIINAKGKRVQVLRSDRSGPMKVSLEGYPTGVYLIQVCDADAELLSSSKVVLR